MEEEWDQSDLRLRNYAQNSDLMSCWNCKTGPSGLGNRILRFWQKNSQNRTLRYGKPDPPVLPGQNTWKFDSWAIGHQIGWNLDTRVTSTQGTSFQKRFFPNPKISLPILDELEEPRFWRNREKSAKSKGLEPWIHSKDGGRWWGSS
jgi:hypothetical protein